MADYIAMPRPFDHIGWTTLEGLERDSFFPFFKPEWDMVVCRCTSASSRRYTFDAELRVEIAEARETGLLGFQKMRLGTIIVVST